MCYSVYTSISIILYWQTLVGYRCDERLCIAFVTVMYGKGCYMTVIECIDLIADTGVMSICV